MHEGELIDEFHPALEVGGGLVLYLSLVVVLFLVGDDFAIAFGVFVAEGGVLWDGCLIELAVVPLFLFDLVMEVFCGDAG